jgi:hypothetical protein
VLWPRDARRGGMPQHDVVVSRPTVSEYLAGRLGRISVCRFGEKPATKPKNPFYTPKGAAGNSRTARQRQGKSK